MQKHSHPVARTLFSPRSLSSARVLSYSWSSKYTQASWQKAARQVLVELLHDGRGDRFPERTNVLLLPRRIMEVRPEVTGDLHRMSHATSKASQTYKPTR